MLSIVSGGFAAPARAGAPAKSAGEARWDGVPAAPQGRYRPGVVLVKFKPGVDGATRDSIAASAHLAGVERSIGHRGRGEEVQVMTLEPGTSVTRAVSELSARPEVEYAEPDYLMNTPYTPNDPHLSDQWGLNNTGQSIEGQPGRSGADIKAKLAWDIEKGNSNTVNVAVIDSGIDYAHADLDSKTWTNAADVSGNQIDDDGNGYVDDTKGYNWAGVSQYNIFYWGGSGWEFSYWGLGSGPAFQTIAQSFTARAPSGETMHLTDVGLLLSRVGIPAANVNVSIRSTLGGPNLASFTIAAGEVTADIEEFYKPLSAPLDLTSGSTYYIVVTTTQNDNNNCFVLFDNWGAEDGTFDAYREGQEWQLNGSWQSWPNDDFYFRTNPSGWARDNNGHGTHVGGIIGAEGNNSKGGAGVSFGSKTKIMPLKTQDSSGSGATSDITAAVIYAAENGADIINMSLGSSSYSSTLGNAVAYAISQGVCVFASAGNDGDSTVNYPAGYPSVNGIGATDNRDTRADFSNYNSTVDFAAPGVDVYSTMPTYQVGLNDEGYTTSYSFLSGTSMASPMAAGVGALILSKHPTYTPTQVTNALKNGAQDLGASGRDNYYGYGRVSANASLGGTDPEPLADCSTWYLAEGSTDWGFDCYVTIENPTTVDVDAKVTFMTTTGPQTLPTLFLPSGSQTMIFPSDFIGATDFSTKVEALGGEPIAVDREMFWVGAGQPVEFEGAHGSIGVTAPAKTWYLPEGSSKWGFETWLLIQNPNSTAAACDVTYMIEGAESITVQKDVPANSRRTFFMADDIGSQDASIKVTSNVPVIPERAMYRNDRREGHDSIGTTTPSTTFYLAEGTSDWGFTSYVLVQNPNTTAADVTLTYMTNSGPVPQPSFSMPPLSRHTIRVNDQLPNTDLSTKVEANVPIIAERAMYWDNGTGEAMHDSIGIAGPHQYFFLPDGRTDLGFETWTLVQNPNTTPVNIEVLYFFPDGSMPVGFEATISPQSRVSYNLEDGIGEDGWAATMVHCTTSGKGVMVERAIYGQNRGSGTDTIGGPYDETAPGLHGMSSAGAAGPGAGKKPLDRIPHGWR
ncbi:MAG: S8 family serine peptidase [Actinobacteria bacterium]|nr:S8 family serine peptidase [Actinomycetota bacterium]